MAQVGRISGPLLEANLLRQGIANGTQQNLSFKNTNTDTTLLKVDVANGRIGVDLEAAANELHVSQTIQTVDLIGDTADIGNLNFSSNNINLDSSDIFLNANEAIIASNLETEQFYITDNYISTKDTNADIDLKFNGTGELEINTNLEVFGNLHSQGDITFDGNITFGDADTDNIDFNADVNSSLIPEVTDTYSIANSTDKRWRSLTTTLVNGQLLASGGVSAGGVFLDTRQGNIFYVSKEGSNSNVGDHPNGALLTIEEALARCDASTDGPVTVLVSPGIYEETCPLVVPDRVTIKGVDLRNTIVKPTVATQDKDVFHLNDSSTIADITIKDYYYDSINNTGYALRFAPNAVITNRSPYVQNLTAITAGSVTSASDPRGFDEGDAGRGAWIDGAELDSASIEASMLFHSCTFICPNADVINMTNGVRVEWLNSFTYFANRGLYAFNGVTGRTTYDGSTVEYGAEVRSIGSANVYGNYGAVADGANTLMYLIQHNMAYIGTGKYLDNDKSRAIQANEVVEANSGVIHFTTTDHTGSFRVGDNFFVDFETGNTTINIDTLTVNQFNALRVVTGADTTIVDGAYIETGNLEVRDNVIESLTGDINVSSATGTINLQNNTNITGDLDITGNLTFDGTLSIAGNEATDSLTFNTALDQNFNPNQHQTFTLGSFAKKWLQAHLNRLETPDIDIYDNVIETKTSNADLELRASGTGNIHITDSAIFNNNVTISGTTEIFDSLNITQNILPISGDINQTGGFSVSGNASINQNLSVGASAQFEEILVDNNYITTTTSNADLELRASGAGEVNLQENVNVTNNLSANDISTQDVTATVNVTANNANIGNVEINDNYIETTSINGDLILGSNRNVVVTGTNVSITPNLTVQGSTDLQNTSVTGTITHSGNRIQNGQEEFSLTPKTYFEVRKQTNILAGTASWRFQVWYNDTLIEEINLTDAIAVDHTDDYLSLSGYTRGAEDPGFILDNSVTDTTRYNIIPPVTFILNGELTVDSVYLEDNFITTNESNADLEIRAEETKDVSIPNNSVVLGQDLTVQASTGLQDTTITGSLTQTGNKTQTGNYTLSGEWTNNNIKIEDNFVTTTNSNSDLELRASSTGEVLLPNNNVQIDNNLTVSSNTDLQGTTITGSLIHVGDTTHTGNITQGGELTVDNVYIEDNFITTTTGNLTLGATGDINVDANDVEIAQDLTVSGATSLQDTTITGTVTQGGNRTQTGNLDIAGEISNGNISIEDNFISTTSSNSDLELRASGTGEVVIDPSDTVTIDNNLFVGGTLTYQGALTINGNVSLLGNVQDGSLTVTNNFDVTGTLDISSQAQFEDIRIEDNFITTTLSNSDLELRTSGTGEVNLQENVQIKNNLFAASISTGDINVNNDLVLDELVITDSNIEINENYISTKISNSNLELRASGTGIVTLQENALLEQNLQVNGDTTLLDTTVNGTLTHVGDRIQNGVYTLDGNLTIGTLVTDEDVSFGDIEVAGNIFQTTLSNSNLEFGASDGDIEFNSDVQIDNNLTVNSINVDAITVTNDLALEIVELSTDIQFEDNVITTTNSNSNLELRAAGSGSIYLDNIEITNNSISTTSTIDSTVQDITISPNENLDITSTSALQLALGNNTDRKNAVGDIRFNTADNIFEGTGSSSTVSLDGVYSENRLTSVSIDKDSNNIRFIVNGATSPLDSSDLVGEITGEGLTVKSLQVDDIQINNNIVSTNVSNSDLELGTTGTGELSLSNISLKDNIVKKAGVNLTVSNTGFGHSKFAGTYGVVVPYGPTINPVVDPEIGDTRWNTTDGQLETWDGTKYVVATGTQAAITQNEFDDLLLEYTIIFG